MKKIGQNHDWVLFESASFGKYVDERSIEEMLDSGAPVKVTSWVSPKMGFGPNGVRVNAAITACLWRTIGSIPETFPSVWSLCLSPGTSSLMRGLAPYLRNKVPALGTGDLIWDLAVVYWTLSHWPAGNQPLVGMPPSGIELVPWSTFHKTD